MEWTDDGVRGGKMEDEDEMDVGWWSADLSATAATGIVVVIDIASACAFACASTAADEEK